MLREVVIRIVLDVGEDQRRVLRSQDDCWKKGSTPLESGGCGQKCDEKDFLHGGADLRPSALSNSMNFQGCTLKFLWRGLFQRFWKRLLDVLDRRRLFPGLTLDRNGRLVGNKSVIFFHVFS